jgi:phospholipid N-methyltransferase
MNRDFVRYLQRTVGDRRLHVVEGSAAEADAVLAARGIRHADYVISGIPYSTMPPEVRERILRTTHDLLHPEGAFLVYQFTRAVLPGLRATFAAVDQEFEPRNIMPARLFFCRPHAERGAAARTREPRPRARASSDR